MNLVNSCIIFRFKVNKSDDEPTETLNPLFYGQTGRDGYKQEMDLFVTQLMGNNYRDEEITNLDLELFETSVNTNEK